MTTRREPHQRLRSRQIAFSASKVEDVIVITPNAGINLKGSIISGHWNLLFVLVSSIPKTEYMMMSWDCDCKGET